MIILDKVYKSYYIKNDKQNALNNINLKINEGDFISIMGPSGSGKSTLMNILGLLDLPTEGRVLMEGQSLKSYNNKTLSYLRNQKLGFVFQNFQLISHLTAYENVEIPLIYAGYDESKREKMVQEALMKMNILNRKNHLPRQLSGGQKQRVGIARSIVNSPRLVLADEPTGSLDIDTGKQMIEVFKELNKEGVAIVIVTHDPTVANHAKKVYNVKNGNLILEGKK